MFLRSRWINYHITLQSDNWPADFCWGSKRKETEWNDFFKILTDWMGSIDSYTKSCKEKAKELAQKYLLGFPDLSFYTFSFDDDSPYMAMLESGEAFSRMCHERISCH